MDMNTAVHTHDENSFKTSIYGAALIWNIFFSLLFYFSNFQFKDVVIERYEECEESSGKGKCNKYYKWIEIMTFFYKLQQELAWDRWQGISCYACITPYQFTSSKHKIETCMPAVWNRTQSVKLQIGQLYRYLTIKYR